MKRDFLHITDFTADEIHETFTLAKAVKVRFQQREDFKPFKDHSMAMIFAKPSARTRISFETGFFRMGGHALYLGPSDISIGKRVLCVDTTKQWYQRRVLKVLREGVEVHLTKTEFRLLCELAESPGKVLSREALLDKVWGYDYFGDGRLVDVHIRRLRTKVESDAANPRHVVTVRGLGYRLQT